MRVPERVGPAVNPPVARSHPCQSSLGVLEGRARARFMHLHNPEGAQMPIPVPHEPIHFLSAFLEDSKYNLMATVNIYKADPDSGTVALIGAREQVAW